MEEVVHKYAAHGLRAIAQYLDVLILGRTAAKKLVADGDLTLIPPDADQIFPSQNDLYTRTGIPGGTISHLRKLRNLHTTNQDWQTGNYYQPTIETLIRLSSVLPDPLTGLPFVVPPNKPGETIGRLEAIARGFDTLIPASSSQSEIQKVIDARLRENPKAFAEAGISKEALQRIRSGQPPKDAIEVMQVGTALYGVDRPHRVLSLFKNFDLNFSA